MSVPKTRRVTSPHHVSDRLRRARNCSSERDTSTHYEDSTNKSFKSFESTTRIRMISRSSAESKSQFFETNQSCDENSIKLPNRVLKLVVTPCKKYGGHLNSHSASQNDNLNVFGIYIEVLKELRQDLTRLEGIDVSEHVSSSENPILSLINDCFQGTYNSSNSSSVLDSCKDLLQYAKTLTAECVEIIERVVYHQSEVIVDLKKESNISTRKKIKTLLLNVMLGIERELINSEKILEIVDTDLHYPSFQFIYCLLKHFIEKIASHLKLSRESGLSSPLSKELSRDQRSVESNTFMHTVSGQTVIPEHKIEEYSNRLDKLMTQWTGTEDSCSEIQNSQNMVIDCYHCLTGNKEEDLLLKKVSRFTEEIKKELINCHRANNRIHCPEKYKMEDKLEAFKTKEPSNDTICSTEMSAYYSWTMTGQNRSRRDGSRNWSHSKCQRPMTTVLPIRNNRVCQDCTRNNGSDYRSLSPPVAAHGSHSRSVSPISNGNKHRSIPPSMADGKSHRSMSPSISNRSNNYYSTYPSMANHHTSRSESPPMGNGRNHRSVSPPMVLPPFPKLQLPNFNLGKTISTQGCSHVPRCISSVGTNQMHKLCNREHQMTGNSCGRCLVICENNPKPPYYDPFPGFKGEGLYGRKYVNAFQPQLFNSFPASPTYEDERKVDKNTKKVKNKERKSTSSNKERNSLSPLSDRKSLSLNIEAQQVNARKNENRGSPTKDDKKPANDAGINYSKAKKEKSKKERSPDRDPSKKENEADSIKTKESYINQNDATTDENQLDGTPPTKPSSRTNVTNPSTPKRADQNAQDAVRRNDNSKETTEEKNKGKPLQESSSREQAAGGKTSKPSDTDGKQNDDHCTCCKCKKNNGNNDNSPTFGSPCYCNGMNNQDSGRPIYQFFATPVPVACNCQDKSNTNKEVQNSKSQHQVGPTASRVSQKKRDSQDAETQTGKKPGIKSDSYLTEPYPSEPSAGQVTPAQSKNDQEPCIENSESCTCTVIYSRSSSRHRRDSQNIETQTQKTESKNSHKSNEKCACPRDIESIFQEFDDKYSKCVQEIKLRIKEGYIPRYNGSEESFTVTREINIIPSRSKSACKDLPSKPSPKQQLKFQEDQDKIYSDDSYMPAETRGHQTDLREDIEELKRLVKNTRIEHCPCCKCCKCENEGKGVVEDKDQVKEPSDSKKQLDQKEPGKNQSEPSSSRGKPPKRHSSKEIEESNKEPPEGAKVIHISPSYVEPELPSDVQDLITPSESAQTKVLSSEKENSRTPSKTDTRKTVSKKPLDKTNQSEAKYSQHQTGSLKSDTSTRSPPQGSDGKIIQPKTKSESGKEGSKISKRSFPKTSEYEQSDRNSKELSRISGTELKAGSDPQKLSKSEVGNVSKPGVGPLKKGELEYLEVSPEKGDLTESKVGNNKPVIQNRDPEKPQRAVTARSGSRSLNASGFEIPDESLETEQVADSKYGSSQQQGGAGYLSEQTTPLTESSLRVSKITIGDGKISIVVSEIPDAKRAEEFESDGSAASQNITNNDNVVSRNEPDQGPISAAEGEYTDVQRPKRSGTKETVSKKEGLAWEDGLKKNEISETSLQNESEVLRVGSRARSQEQRPSKKPLVETRPQSVSYGTKSTPEKQQKKITLVFDDEAEKQREMSLERQALNQSREYLFRQRSDSEVPAERESHYLTPRDEESKKSWNPFESIFGGFGRKNDESETSKKEQKSEEYSRITGDKIDEEPKLSAPDDRDDDGDTNDSDLGSCGTGNPCVSTYSSCSTIDECKELLDSLPCNFYSDESASDFPSSVTNVIKETETELYVMIIESQTPVAQTDRHDEIISLLLSGNNNSKANFSGNGNTETNSIHKHLKTLSNVPHTSTPSKSHSTRETRQNERGLQPCFPVEFISLQPSYESVTQVSEIESSDELSEASFSNEQLLSPTRISSHSRQQQKMRERKSPRHSKEEEKQRPRSCRNPPQEKKKRSYHDTQNYSADLAVPNLESQITAGEVEFLKKTENKEVQVTKWNAKCQTAGPRKFNRTDIPREVEDKLAVYLGLERTAEQTDLKVTPMGEDASKLRGGNERRKPSKEELKRSSNKNSRNLAIQD